ncbi:protein of unknown function [Shewanella benthica]|uniref:Uncharacterized protein n=1 Tax=Shewanella benthica TaxID=43661 RepID=A0A330M5R3_9GAMM|nr:protein of unknown function [Shewanella benthica]
MGLCGTSLWIIDYRLDIVLICNGWLHFFLINYLNSKGVKVEEVMQDQEEQTTIVSMANEQVMQSKSYVCYRQ